MKFAIVKVYLIEIWGISTNGILYLPSCYVNVSHVTKLSIRIRVYEFGKYARKKHFKLVTRRAISVRKALNWIFIRNQGKRKWYLNFNAPQSFEFGFEVSSYKEFA